jgi:AcrR family transcriptional regulator
MSPRSAKQFDDIRKQKKRLILDTALELFAENGYHSTSISKIAKKAGISKGLTYNYFESKKEILGEILREGFETIYSNFDLNHDGVLTEDEFKFFILQNFKAIKQNPRYWKLYYSLTLQPTVTESFINDYADFSKQLVGMLYQFVVSCGSKNPNNDMFAISALIKGASLILVSTPNPWATENFEDHIIETCFKIIRN